MMSPRGVPAAPELAVETGWIAAPLRSELPELVLRYAEVAARPGRSPKGVKQRLKGLSDRFTGGKAVAMRRQAVPWAYRVFFRQIGLDPDAHPTPPEELALERMRRGRFASRSLVDDALTIACVETGVGLMALDAGRLRGRLGLRVAEPDERLGGAGRPLSVRQLVLADELRSVAIPYGEVAEGYGVEPRTRRIALVALQPRGVPDASVDESLWLAAETLMQKA